MIIVDSFSKISSGLEEELNRMGDSLNIDCVLEYKFSEKISFYFKIHGELDSTNVVILYNGALNEKTKKFVFHRSTWADEIGGLIINVDDATTQIHQDIVIGWGQGTLADYFSLTYHQILVEILKSLNIRKSNRIHCGSSAGGYQAIVGSALDLGSRAIVFNPQIQWVNHFFLGPVDRLRNICFKSYSTEALLCLYPDRVNCMYMAYKVGNIPSIDYYVNTAFNHDVNIQLGFFYKFISRNDIKEYLVNRFFNIYMKNNENLGHNPPSKLDTISYIHKRFI